MAGPALEGCISRYGMRVGPGAIDHVQISDGHLTDTIIDLLAHMRLAGWMDISGRLQPEASNCIIYLEEEQQYNVLYATRADGAPLLLNRELMQEIKYPVENMYCIQFAFIPDFLVRMQAAKFVPHTDMNRFPTIREQLEERR